MDEGDIASLHAERMLEAQLEAQRNKPAEGPVRREDGMCTWCESAPALEGSACCGSACLEDWEYDRTIRQRQGLRR